MEAFSKIREGSTFTPALSLAEYAAESKKCGQRVVRGEGETLWVESETFAMIRFPVFELKPPSPEELRRVLWRGPAAVATYLLQPNQNRSANTYVYTCTDKTYTLEKLLPAARRNIRRGLKELDISPLTIHQVLAHGYRPYSDWLRRVGLEGETRESFHKNFIARASCSAHVFLGAWKDGKLAAFLSITELDEWVEIDGCFSADALLHLRPNETLFFSALSYYMKNGRCRTVSYGVSSLQAVSNKDGLHAFKKKVGFEAKPVHRTFAFHPLFRPLANRISLWAVNAALRFKPHGRALKKAEGMLACILGEDRLPQGET